jgi:hypothetical protein
LSWQQLYECFSLIVMHVIFCIGALNPCYGTFRFQDQESAVLEMKIGIYCSESNSWIYFYVVLNKNWKIYWSKQSFTVWSWARGPVLIMWTGSGIAFLYFLQGIIYLSSIDKYNSLYFIKACSLMSMTFIRSAHFSSKILLNPFKFFSKGYFFPVTAIIKALHVHELVWWLTINTAALKAAITNIDH